MKKKLKHSLFYVIVLVKGFTKMKNYYDILQVNKNASPEIIEKAYKTLAKKYHPDLQSEENKQSSEEILKEINEAYEVLSNPEKKQPYDASLLQEESRNSSSTTAQQETSSSYQPSQTGLSEEELRYRQQQEFLRQEQLQREQQLAYQEQIQQARQKAYHDAYIQDLKNRGYRIRYKKSLQDYIKSFIAILITILILFLLAQIPFIKKFLINLYEENILVHVFVDFILNFFQ